MPVMGGLEAARAIRALPESASVPIVAVTASTGSESTAEQFAAGFDEHLPKPVRSGDLFELIARYPRQPAMTPPPANVLIVDDHKRNRDVLHDLVLSLGHVPTLAESGEAALETLRQASIDLVLLDILMPGMDGHEVLAQMKADEALRSLPVLVVSAVDDVRSVLKAIRSGAEDYLVKPIHVGLLKARLGACLEKKRLRDRERALHAELVSSYESLKSAEQARDSLTRMIVHDLNNPLTNIMGYAELVLDLAANGPVPEERLVKYLGIVARASADMARMIQGLLDTARLESGELPVSAVELDAVPLVAEVCADYAARAEKTGVELTCQAGPEPVLVLADRDLLLRVLQNLLANALKHTPKGTTVTVSLEQAESAVLFTVSDTGPGIPAELLGRIFDKFFQMELKKAGAMRGVGLGLAFCKLAAEAQGGAIAVESTLGEGTSMRVSLPAPG